VLFWLRWAFVCPIRTMISFSCSLFFRGAKKTVTYFRPDAVLDEKTSFNGSKTHFHQTSVRDAFDFALYCIKSLDWVGGRCCSKESKIPVSQTTFEGLHMPLWSSLSGTSSNSLFFPSRLPLGDESLSYWEIANDLDAL